MPTTSRTRSTSRAASTARSQILKQLKDDHKRVKKAYKEFQKIGAEEDPDACEAIVQQVLQELSVHAALEEELLYPAAREAIAEVDLIDEAEVEHESMHTFIDQLKTMRPDEDKYAARFTVLCEYVLHHVKEEEEQMFPQLQRTQLDWEDLASQMAQRRVELAPEEEEEPAGDEAMQAMPADAGAGKGRAAASARRSTAARGG